MPDFWITEYFIEAYHPEIFRLRAIYQLFQYHRRSKRGQSSS